MKSIKTYTCKIHLLVTNTCFSSFKLDSVEIFICERLILNDLTKVELLKYFNCP